jgi:signal transduction histidine kinase
MNKLRNKIFYTVFGILTIALLGFIVVFNIQNYQDQKDNVKRSISFSGMARTLPNDPLNRNIRFMDANVITIRLDKNDNVVEVINHSNEEVDNTKLIELANDILSSKNLKREYIGFLYTEKYSYSYFPGNRLIIYDNSFAQSNLNEVLRNSLIFFVVLELIFILIAKLISHWISRPVEEAFNKQKEFIADASHELKTPLSVITASAEALEKSPKEKKWLTNIKNESDRMNNLIIDLLDLAKLENGNIELSNGNLSKIVELSVLTFEGIAFEKNIKFDYHITDNINMKMNENSIKQLLEILLDNAIKHSKEKGKIEINLKETNNIELTVSNLGDEIPKGEEEKIFERFYRVDKSRNRNDNRYGLGLSIAKNIVTLHNGVIKAYSKNGKTTFQINFKK